MGCFCPPHCLFLCTQWAYSFNEMRISTSSLSALSCSAGCSFSSFHTFTIWDLKKADLLSQFLFLALSSLSTSISPTLFQLHTAKGFWTLLEQYSCLLVPAIPSTSQVYTETLFPISAVTQMTLRPRTWRRFLSCSQTLQTFCQKTARLQEARVTIVTLFLLGLLSIINTTLLFIRGKVAFLFVCSCLNNTPCYEIEYFWSHKWELSWNHPNSKNEKKGKVKGIEKPECKATVFG